MSEAPSGRTRVRLSKELGVYDRDVIYSIVDEAPLCHVSTIVEGAPYVIPTVHWRIDGSRGCTRYWSGGISMTP